MPANDPRDLRWGWRCPRCDADAAVTRDPGSSTFCWACTDADCPAVGFGFRTRRRARLALRALCEEYDRPYR